LEKAQSTSHGRCFCGGGCALKTDLEVKREPVGQSKRNKLFSQLGFGAAGQRKSRDLTTKEKKKKKGGDGKIVYRQ